MVRYLKSGKSREEKENANQKIKEFIEEAKKHIPDVQASIVTHQRGVDETRCEEMVGKDFGVKYRARRYNIVG